jgi:hypothetical protein
MVIRNDDLISLGSAYEEIMYAPDPTIPSIRQAKLLFDHECRSLLQQETMELQNKMDLATYQACLVIPQILQYLKSTNVYPSV